MALNIGPVAQLRGIDPNAFERRTPDLTGVADPFTVAASALTAGLIVGEQKLRDRQEADRAYLLQKRQFEESVRQFGDVHQLNLKEADNLANYRRDSQALQSRNLDLQNEMWDAEAKSIDQKQQADQIALDEMRRQIDRRRRFEDRMESIRAKATTYGYSDDPYGDSNSLAGIGHADNKLIPGVSVALSRETADKLGIQGKEPVDLEVVLPDGTVQNVKYHDTIPSRYKEDRIDFFTPDKDFQFDGRYVEVRRKGDDGTRTRSILRAVPDQGPATAPRQDRSSAILQTYDEWKSITEDPTAPEEAVQEALFEMQRMVRNPAVQNKLNSDDADKIAKTLFVGEMGAGVREDFKRYVGNLGFRATPEQLVEIAKGFATNHAAAVEAMTPDFNKPVAEVAKRTQSLGTAFRDIGRLEEAFSAVNEGQVGRLQGRFFGLFDKVVEQKGRARLEAIVNGVLPNLARGVFGEVGVLTDADIERYRKMIPDARSSKELQDIILNDLRDKIQMEIRSDIDAADTIRGENPELIREYFRRSGVNLGSLFAPSGPAQATINTGRSKFTSIENPDGSHTIVESATPGEDARQRIEKAQEANEKAAAESARTFGEISWDEAASHRGLAFP